MNKQLQEMIEKLTGYWQGLAKRQRLNLVAVFALVIVVAGLITFYGLQKNYVPAFSNLDDASAGQVVNQLKNMGIDYKLVGNTIEVPEAQADEVRMQLAVTGIPKSGTFTYSDLFNNNGLGGVTDNMFNAEYQAVLEGNLATTIQSIDGIQNAKVQIVMPQQQLFVEQQTNNAKASVFVNLRSGITLTAGQVSGIQRLVAYSVKGLLPENVTVVNQSGIRLKSDLTSSDGTDTSTELDTTSKIEQNVQNDIQNAVGAMVGAGNVTVTVHADVSYDKVNQTSSTVSPVVGNNGIIVSQEKTSSSSQGSSPVGGAAGVTTQTPGQGNVKSASSTNDTSSSSSTTTNYDYNKTQTTTVSQQYNVKSYHVAIVVNGNLTAQQKKDISALAASTIGGSNDGSLNNQITVVAAPAKTPIAFNNSQPFYQNPTIMGGIAVGALLLGSSIFLIGRRRNKLASSAQFPEAAAFEPRMLVREETEQQKVKKQLEKLADQKPDEFVNLLRTWLVEE